jgi:hypothetical protein
VKLDFENYRGNELEMGRTLQWISISMDISDKIFYCEFGAKCPVFGRRK